MDFRSFKSLILNFFFVLKKKNIINKLELIKPGIIIGNIISLSGGFFLASRGYLLKLLFMKVILGMTFIIAASCILNNIIDRNLDKTMLRTKNRILCNYKSNTLIYILFLFAILCIFLGLYIFYKYINFISMILSLTGIFFYVILYSFFFKKKSCYSIFVGSVSGSIPPIIGYISVHKALNGCCLILFFIFIFWQIVHSYSIIIYRYTDYKQANIPNFVTKYNRKYTNIFMSVCIVSMFILNLLLYYFHYVRFFYFLSTSFFIFMWFLFSIIKNIFFYSYEQWSRIMFFISIFIIFLISLILSINFYKYSF
ncbi:Protoheme IX farnesyltransferase [Buchnera aphidicola (Cinara cuneomaculata)]|uniref:Protoheme IX farnesyltransferase n=1 Tax=Buchnera aphidicola (Cinara cuneomaculata) TaxID=1660040 RepID=A0A451CY03_9GAMM|nr:protoheme IX farnesyltransferase [Buchnera aphidicola]VFP78275.1 Protoheme IX farnesyltransferase [Buchnera aphidicola (Cinara cuneomaculata)]